MENVVTKDFLYSAYNNKKVFLTGHTGFKGSWLTAMLHKLGAVVKGYALAPEYETGLFNFIWNDAIGESVIADIRQKERLRAELLDFTPDFIFHLAAQPLVRRSYQIPAETFEINATGTANLLEALTSLQNKCTVILVTTDKIYHNKESFILYKEEDRLGGYDPYSASKACAELIAEAFRSSFFNKEKWELHHKSIVTVRAGNVIGGGDWSIDRLVPDVVRSLIKGEEIQVRNPKSIRPWQHVLEPLGGYLLLGALLHSAPGHYSNAYNFGPLPDDHLSVKDLVQRCLQFWGNGSWCDHSDPNQPHEAGVLMLNIAKAMEELKWHPKWNATQSIKNTIEWYKQPLELAAETTYNQIEAYLSL